ncbi:MAG: hypothetical protein GX428_08240 [Candidatus Atribacteria bacterium]|nr:hypothetical protein [Candidatus Atribacteria bacterium]
MINNNYKIKTFYTLIFWLFFIYLLFTTGCTSSVPLNDENQITQQINKYFQAINSVNQEKALSCTIPKGAAYEATNKFFNTKVPLAEQKNTQYLYSFEIQSIEINDDFARVHLTYSFRLIGFDDMASPTFNDDFTLKRMNGSWLLSTAPLAS